MAGLDADTSSYPKPQAPANPLDIANKLGGLEQQRNTITQQGLQINQAKLDQAEQAVQYLTREMTTIGPNGKPEDYLRVAQDVAKTHNLPSNTLDVFRQRMDSYKTPNGQFDSSRFFDDMLAHGANHQERFNMYRGQVRSDNTGNNIILNRIPGSPNVEPSRVGVIPNQVNPGFETVDQNGQKSAVGNLPPPETPGITTNRLGASIASPLPAGAYNPKMVPGMGPNETATGATVLPVQNSGRFPTSLPSGEGALMEAGSNYLAKARERAINFQREIFPLAQAIPALETLGTKGTGPGTEALNHLKSFILSNMPGVRENDPGFASVPTYDKAKKYLTDFVNQTGSSGTNDKLAAAFAGNPSVNISNAAAVDVAKSAMALRRMEQAIYHEFEAQKLPASKATQWTAKRMQELDPRAFGVDMMNKEQLDKLNDFKTQDEADQFHDSLELAKKMKFIKPR